MRYRKQCRRWITWRIRRRICTWFEPTKTGIFRVTMKNDVPPLKTHLRFIAPGCPLFFYGVCHKYFDCDALIKFSRWRNTAAPAAAASAREAEAIFRLPLATALAYVTAKVLESISSMEEKPGKEVSRLAIKVFVRFYHTDVSGCRTNTVFSWQHFPPSTSSRSRCDDSSMQPEGSSLPESCKAEIVEEEAEASTSRVSSTEYPIVMLIFMPNMCLWSSLNDMCGFC